MNYIDIVLDYFGYDEFVTNEALEIFGGYTKPSAKELGHLLLSDSRIECTGTIRIPYSTGRFPVCVWRRR